MERLVVSCHRNDAGFLLDAHQRFRVRQRIGHGYFNHHMLARAHALHALRGMQLGRRAQYHRIQSGLGQAFGEIAGPMRDLPLFRHDLDRYRGLAQDLKRPLLVEYLLKNIFFDTCVYHLPGIELLLKVIPADNIIFGSEMVGAVRGIDPQTGQYFDDTKRYLDALHLSDADRYKIFEGNARKVFPRLASRLAH